MKWLYAILALIYLFSPWDIFPDFFIGWGWLDDLVILGLLWRFFYTQNRSGYRYRTDSEQSSHGNGNRRDKDSTNTHSTAGEPDPHTVLGVAENASPEEIKAAYRQLVNKYHPDKVLHLGEEFKTLAEKRFKEIQAAYDRLTSR